MGWFLFWDLCAIAAPDVRVHRLNLVRCRSVCIRLEHCGQTFVEPTQ